MWNHRVNRDSGRDAKAHLPAVVDADAVEAEVGERGGLAVDGAAAVGDGVDGGADGGVVDLAVEAVPGPPAHLLLYIEFGI